MRLGIDASNLRAGGGVTHLIELLRHADPPAHGFDEAIVWSGSRTAARLPERPWLRVVREPDIDGSLPRRVLWRNKLAELARGCDVLFVPGGGYNGTFRPRVTMCRNMLPFDFREMRRYGLRWLFWRAAMLRFVLLRSFRGADGLIFLNEYARSRVGPFLGRGGPELAVIPHGISDDFRREPRPQRPLDGYTHDRPFRFLYTSIVDMYKHQWTVAEGVMQLRREGLPVAIDLIGPPYPPAQKKLDEALRRGGEAASAVRVHGEVGYADLPPFYVAADAFVFASTCENMPNILIEAMAAGLPIACAEAGPMPEILRDGGVYFDAENPADIARALRELAQDPELRARKAARAAELAREFSWSVCANETFAFLAKVARG